MYHTALVLGETVPEGINGLWTLEYEGDAYLSGGGVIIVQGETVSGGDSWYYFDGKLQLNGTQVSADVRVRAFVSSATTVFGPDAKDFTVRLVGELHGPNMIRGKISPSFAPAKSLGITLLKRF